MFPQYARITVKIKTIGLLIWSLSYAPAMTRFCLEKKKIHVVPTDHTDSWQ